MWIRELAGRQGCGHNRVSLERYATMVERVLAREIVPGRDGELGEELRHRLDVHSFLIEPRGATEAFILSPAEEAALAAVVSAALFAPTTVLGDLVADLPRIIGLICRRSADSPPRTSRNGPGGR